MKKILLAALLSLLGGTAALTAQERPVNEPPANEPSVKERPLKEPRVRIGIGYRYSFALTEAYGVKIPSLNHSSWGKPENRLGGMLQIEGTIRITPNWNTGLGFGFTGLSGNKTFAVYGKGERLYGTDMKRSRVFNYAQLGITTYPENGVGGMAALGVGCRLSIAPRTRMDFTFGMEWANIVGGAYGYIPKEDVVRYYPKGGRYHRIGLTVGIALHF